MHAARPSRLLALSGAEAALGRPNALEHLAAAARLGADHDELAEVTARCLASFAWESSPPETLAILGTLAEHLGQGHDDLRIWIELVLATWGPQPSALAGTSAVAPTPIASVLSNGQARRTRRQRLALSHLASVKSLTVEQDGAVLAADLAEQAVVADDLELEDATSIVLVAGALATLVRAGRFEPAERLGRAALASALTGERPYALAEFSSVLAYAHLLQGDLDESEAGSRRALDAMEGRSWASRPFCLGVLAASLMEGGRVEEAALVLDDAAGQSVPSSLAQLFPLEQLARIEMQEGDMEGALKLLRLVERGSAALGVTNPAVTSWRALSASALMATGRRAEAKELAEENLELARAFGAPWALGTALRTTAEVAQGPERLDILTEAVGVLEPAGASLECARAKIDLGLVLIDRGRQREALSALRRGADLAFRCRAQPLAERATRELRAAGARPRRLALMGADALTPAERRVAELAAAGLLNAQIAESLFVSEKTVEGHLTRVYQKLGKQSRSDLGEILKPLPRLSLAAADSEHRAV